MTGVARTLVRIIRRLLPWLVAAGILSILIRRAGGAPLREAVRDADLVWLLGATVVCTLGMFALDAVALARAISWFNCPISARDIAPVKAAAYLLNIINYNAGSGAIAVWLARHRQVPFLEAASAVLFVNIVDALVLVAFMAIGLPAFAPPLRAGVVTIVGVTAVLFVGNLLYWRAGFDFLILGRLRHWPIFKSFRAASFAHYLRLAAIRVPFDLLFIANHWAGLRAFGIDVPAIKILAYVPVISFIGVVPITVSGLGTVQAAVVFLFSPYGTEARLLAFSLVLTLALSGVRALLGVPVFRRVSEDIFRGRRDTDIDQANSGAAR
ncbi:MAG: hypothetical protein A3J75_07735 [Acidobacteria bacterium RBG_16_68_9]|nr:MAG: hypothetical protein A3J75_07735 [Acidobacteria bacterium RBG_16_68_9]